MARNGAKALVSGGLGQPATERPFLCWNDKKRNVSGSLFASFNAQNACVTGVALFPPGKSLHQPVCFSLVVVGMARIKFQVCMHNCHWNNGPIELDRNLNVNISHV